MLLTPWLSDLIPRGPARAAKMTSGPQYVICDWYFPPEMEGCDSRTQRGGLWKDALSRVSEVYLTLSLSVKSPASSATEGQ